MDLHPSTATLKPNAYYELVINGEPVTALRARAAKDGHHYTPVQYREYKLKVANAIKGKFAREIMANKDDPKQAKQKRYALLLLIRLHRDHGDWDNYAKAIQDALQDAGLVHDDRQVTVGFCAKCIQDGPLQAEFCLFEIPESGPQIVIAAFRVMKYLFAAYKPGSHLGALAVGYGLWEGREYGINQN